MAAKVLEADSVRSRRYDICRALSMTCLSIELHKLERLGMDKRVIARWYARATHLLDDILDGSASLS